MRGVAVTEAPIDVISLEALYSGLGCRHILAMNGLKKSTPRTYLEEFPHPNSVFLCLDSDTPGVRTARELEVELKATRDVAALSRPYLTGVRVLMQSCTRLEGQQLDAGSGADGPLEAFLLVNSESRAPG